MSNPGAATSTAAPWLLNEARASSGPAQVLGPSPPRHPSESASAETVVTSGYFAGAYPPASAPSLPAATARRSPPARALQTAWWSEELSHLLGSSPEAPARLMLATPMPRAAAQSRPQMSHDQLPEPSSPSTLTAHSPVPGATPTIVPPAP